MPDRLAARGTGVVLAYGAQVAVDASDFVVLPNRERLELIRQFVPAAIAGALPIRVP